MSLGLRVSDEKTENKDRLSSLLEENTERLLTCVHCGLCLPACPTYRQLGNENDSPRGRIYLMRGVAEGRLRIAESFVSHIDLCLGCRACEPVCPSGVPYGHLLEAARVEVAKAEARRGSPLRRVVSFALNQVFTRPRLLGLALGVARWVRDSGAVRLALETGLVGGRLRFALALLVASRSPLAREAHNRHGDKDSAEAREVHFAGRRARVAVLRGCVMEGLFTETNRATERVLRVHGCETVEAAGQMCCGALHAHAGEIEAARLLARKNIDAFLASECERVIVNSAGCGAAMKEYSALLADDPRYAERAKQFSSKVRDVSEFLVEIGIRPPRASVERRVAYDAPCHLLHAQRIDRAPVEVLKAIPGITLVPLEGSEGCCGGAGIYNLQHRELSGQILSDKLASILASGADTIATANPGCIMQIKAGLILEGRKVDVIHPVELLDSAYFGNGNSI